MRVVNANKLVDAGCIVYLWVADWFALLNQKMKGIHLQLSINHFLINFNYLGDLTKIKILGYYFIEIWKALGIKMHNVKFLWASNEIINRANEYWLTVFDIASSFTLDRIKKTV